MKRSNARPKFGPLYAVAPHHPKVYELARRLGVPRVVAWGHLSTFWAEGTALLINGEIPGTARWVAGHADWFDRPPEDLTDAMIGVGFIDVDAEGRWWVHDWQDYGGVAEEKVQSGHRPQDNFKGATGARGRKKKTEEEQEEGESGRGAATAASRTAIAAASCSPLVSSSFDSRFALPEEEQEAAAGGAGGIAMQDVDLRSPFDDAGPPRSYLPNSVDALLARRIGAEGKTLGELLSEDFSAFDGRGGRRRLRDVVLRWFNYARKKPAAMQLFDDDTLFADISKWMEEEYKVPLDLKNLELKNEAAAKRLQAVSAGPQQPSAPPTPPEKPREETARRERPSRPPRPQPPSLPPEEGIALMYRAQRDPAALLEAAAMNQGGAPPEQQGAAA